MKNLFLFAFLLSVTTFYAQVPKVVESEAKITFTFLDDEVNGTMEEFKFTGELNFEDISKSVLSGTVATNSIDTNNWLRSRHLRAKKYFNSSDYPTLSFRSISIVGNSNVFQATGTLTIKGVEKTIIWSFTNDGKVLIGSATIYTSDFKINIHSERQRNKVIVFLTIPYIN